MLNHFRIPQELTDGVSRSLVKSQEIPMSRQNLVRMALFICLGLVAVAVRGFAAEEKEKQGAQVPNAKARRDAARAVYEVAAKARLGGVAEESHDLEFFHDWSVRWLQAERDLDQKKAGQIAALEGHLNRMLVWNDLMGGLVKQGQVSRIDASTAEFFRLEAEDWLAAARADGK
jgi:hypothetical protein